MLQNNPHNTDIRAQDYVKDKEDGGEAVVRAVLNKPAEDRFVPELGGSVAALNPGYSPKSDVALISFKGQLRATYGENWHDWLAGPTFEAEAASYRLRWRVPDAMIYTYPCDRLERIWRYDGDAHLDDDADAAAVF